VISLFGSRMFLRKIAMIFSATSSIEDSLRRTGSAHGEGQ
jgi:hypothetical protein